MSKACSVNLKGFLMCLTNDKEELIHSLSSNGFIAFGGLAIQRSNRYLLKEKSESYLLPCWGKQLTSSFSKQITVKATQNHFH